MTRNYKLCVRLVPGWPINIQALDMHFRMPDRSDSSCDLKILQYERNISCSVFYYDMILSRAPD